MTKDNRETPDFYYADKAGDKHYIPDLSQKNLYKIHRFDQLLFRTPQRGIILHTLINKYDCNHPFIMKSFNCDYNSDGTLKKKEN